MPKSIYDLSEKEILALAITLEENDGRIYGEFAERMRPNYPKTAAVLDTMREEESGHRHRLTETYRQKFGEHIPLIRRQDVKGFVERRPEWLARPLGIQNVRKQAEVMELETRRFYERAISEHIQIGIATVDLLRQEGSRLHSRKLRAFDEPPFRCAGGA